MLAALMLALTLPVLADSGNSGKGKPGDDTQQADNSGKGNADDQDRDDNDDDSGRHGNDDGTPDQGPGDNGATTPGNDDGTPDQGPGDNGADQNQRQRDRFFFGATTSGMAIRAKGHVDIRQRGARQKITIEVEALVPDGTTFVVFANGEPIGSLLTMFGEDELELKNFDGQMLPAAVNPVSGVRRVEVFDAAGTLVLELDL